VTDVGADRVSVFDSDGVHLFSFGSSGSAPGLLDYPADVAIRNGGKIYVTDTRNDRIQIFSPTGQYLDAIGPDIDGMKAPLDSVAAIQFNSEGNIVLLEGDQDTSIYVIDLDGKLVLEMDGAVEAQDLSVDQSDRVWVRTQGLLRVSDHNDVLLGTWPIDDATNAPAFDSTGRAVIANLDTSRIEVYKFYECNNRLATYVGTPNADAATGTNQDDVAVLRGGDDIFIGGPGRDTICGGPGADTLHGGPGLDWIYGQGGPDELYGNGQKDRVFGGSGLDVIFGGGGPDWLYGGNHRDELRGGGGPDNLFGGNGPDDCYGGPGTDAATSCASEVGIP